MKHLLIGFLCSLCLTSCKKPNNNYDPAFAVITKEPLNIGPDSTYARGAIISMDQVYMREKGFIWHSLTPPTPPNTFLINKTSFGGGNSQAGDFGTYIHYQASVKDSFVVRAYAITNSGDSMSGLPVKFHN